jgi:hypothetical protein
MTRTNLLKSKILATGIVLFLIVRSLILKQETVSLPYKSEDLEHSHNSPHINFVTNSFNLGIDAHRKANAKQAALHTKHHEDLIRQKEAEEKRKSEEATYWESRQAWINQFPFEPDYHPDITFDPEVYNPVGPGGPSDYTTEGQKMARMVSNHGFLSAFYENSNRYSPEFEKIYDILLEEGIIPDPMLCGWTFTHLVDYHKASTHDLETPWPPDPSITWGEDRMSTWKSMAGRFQTDEYRTVQVDTLPSEAEAARVRQRLIDEIPAEGFLKVNWLEKFAYHSEYENMLKPGDSLLIK